MPNPNDFKVSVIPTEWENCFIAISLMVKKRDKPFEQTNTQSNLSFCVVNENKTSLVEWEPNYGPIAIYRKNEGKNKHWYLVENVSNDWTQLGVDRERLSEKFFCGHLEYLFNTLKDYL